MTERYFALPDLDASSSSDTANRGTEFYIRHFVDLSQKCWSHYEDRATSKKVTARSYKQTRSPKQTLYIGSLGPCVYLRYLLASSPSFPKFTMYHKQSGSDVTEIIRASRIQMYRDAFFIADGIIQKRSQEHDPNHRVTLLEGELVGALTMKIVIGHAIVSLMEDNENSSLLTEEIEKAMKQFLFFGRKYILSGGLASSECEVLYGRCGYLKAIKFIQIELGDPHFGENIAREIIQEVWEEGRQDFNASSFAPLPLIWSWHSKIYLGACHGVTGILHTLLDFQDVSTPIHRQLIEQTVVLLRENMCYSSGNLASSITSKSDELVQWCHGAPGHVLLLTQMARKTRNHTYLGVANDLAASVIQPRGLLRKGVGLCHGIAGNAFCFLSLANVVRDLIQGDDHIVRKWINTSFEYANFAIDHFDELESEPDRPFSLYEGMAGLSCLLLALIEGGEGPSSKFPLYEV